MRLDFQNKKWILLVIVLVLLFRLFIQLSLYKAGFISVEYFIENSGAALAPTLAGAIALATNKQTAILSVCVTAWVLCFFLYLGALFFISSEAQALRDQMRERAEHEQLRHTAG